MKSTLLMLLILLGFSTTLTAQPILLLTEDFESTPSWTVNSTCASYPWVIATGGPASSTQCAGYPSLNAPASCTSDLFSTIVSVSNPGLDDSIITYFDFLHSTNYPSNNDRIELSLTDTFGLPLVIAPGQLSRYNGTSGWVRYFYRVRTSEIVSGPGTTYFKLMIRGISDYGDNVFIDNVSMYHVKHKPIMTVLDPNGGETLEAGFPYDLNWFSPEVALLKLSYSTNGGLSWTAIDSNVTGNSGTYTWTVPTGLSSTTARFRITDQSNSAYFDQSDANFKFEIPVKVKVLSPNGGNTLTGGAVANITWSATNVSKVNLEYSLNGGANWTSIASNLTASTGTYAWTVPTTATTNALIRVTSSTNAAVFDDSDAGFTIQVVPFVQLLQPNGGVTLNAGAAYNITWTSNNVNNVNLELSLNGGSNWTSIASNIVAATGAYSWTVPASATTNALVRVADASNAAVFDQSDAAFTISTVPSLQLLTPNGGNTLGAGSTYNITWSSANVNTVNLEFSANGGSSWSSIATNLIAGTGSYTWTVPASATTNGLVRVTDASNASVTDASNSAFTITVTPFLQLLEPNGGNNLPVGSIFNITWSSGNINNVNLELSTNGGSSWSSIASNLAAGSGSYAWTVPANATTNAKIRISDAANASVNDASDAVFTISVTPFVQVLTPNGTENISSGSVYNVTWTSANVTNVSIDFSANGGVNWTSIASNLSAGTGTYAWTVPAISTNTAKVRVRDAANASVNDESDAYFTVDQTPTVDLLTPNGGATLTAGNVFNITWSAPGSTNINLELSVNGGVNWTSIATNLTASTGTYAWTVPPVSSTTAKVRVSDASNAQNNDESDAYFTIEQNTSGIGYTPAMELKLYPNPVKDKLSISFNRSGQTVAAITVRDISGRVLLVQPTTINGGKVELDLSSLQMSQGVYLLELREGDTVATAQFIVN